MKEKKDKSLWDIYKRTIIIVIFTIIALGIFSYSNRPNVDFRENQQKQKGIIPSGYNELLMELEEGIKQGKIKVVNVRFGYNKITYEFSWYNNAKKIIVLKSIAEEYYLPLFNEYKVSLIINDVNQSGGYSGYIFWFILLAYFWFFMMRRRGGGNPLAKFRQTQTKISQTEEIKTTFLDVAGCDEVKFELQEVVEFLKNPDKFNKLGGELPRGTILMGPPGCGKTLLARAVAGEAKVPFLAISASEFVEMFVGVGASRIRDLFDKAEANAPCIIFIDEIETVGRKRGIGIGQGNDEREQTLNQLLSEMDGFYEKKQNIIILAATNQPDQIDDALLRPGRFDRQIEINLPDFTGRLQILKVHAKKIILSPEVSLEIIAKETPMLSGADLKNIINEAAIFASRKNKNSVEMEDLEESVEKVSLGLKQGSRKMSDKEKQLVAYHEAGHTVIAEILEHTDPVHTVSIIPRGIESLGQTRQLPQEDKNIYTKEELKDLISVLLGGRAAEMLIYKTETTGAQNDLERATDIAKKYVKIFGMSGKIGPRCFGSASESFINTGWVDTKDYSEKTAQLIDDAISELLTECQEITKKSISENKDKLEKVYQGLMEKEILKRQDLDKIFPKNK